MIHQRTAEATKCVIREQDKEATKCVTQEQYKEASNCVTGEQYKLDQDGTSITTRELIDGRVILRRGEGTFLHGCGWNSGSRRSGGFITTCLEGQEWCALFSLGKND